MMFVPRNAHRVRVRVLRFCKLVYPLDRAYDAVLLCTGWKFDSSIFAAEALPQMTVIEAHQRRSRSKKYPELTHAYESANVHGMYFAGTLTHGKDYQKAAAFW